MYDLDTLCPLTVVRRAICWPVGRPRMSSGFGNAKMNRYTCGATSVLLVKVNGRHLRGSKTLGFLIGRLVRGSLIIRAVLAGRRGTWWVNSCCTSSLVEIHMPRPKVRESWTVLAMPTPVQKWDPSWPGPWRGEIYVARQRRARTISVVVIPRW